MPSIAWKDYFPESNIWQKSRVMLRSAGASVMVIQCCASHNPHFYCLLTGFPATQAALSGIALCHESLTSPGWEVAGRWQQNQWSAIIWRNADLQIKLRRHTSTTAERGRRWRWRHRSLGRLPSWFLLSTLGDTEPASLISIPIYTWALWILHLASRLESRVLLSLWSKWENLQSQYCNRAMVERLLSLSPPTIKL